MDAQSPTEPSGLDRTDLYENAKHTNSKAYQQRTERLMKTEPVRKNSVMLMKTIVEKWNGRDQLVRVNPFRIYLLAYRTVAEVGKRWLMRTRPHLLAELTRIGVAIAGLDEEVLYQCQYIGETLQTILMLFGQLDDLLGDCDGFPSGIKNLEHTGRCYLDMTKVVQKVMWDIWGDLKL